MSNHKYRIPLPELSDYVYRTMKGLTPDQKEKLNLEERRLLKNDTALHDFCHKEQLDRLLLLLIKTGKYWDLRIYSQEDSVNQLEFAEVTQFQFPQKRVEAIEAIVRENIFSMDANDVAFAAAMSTQNIHSSIYELSNQAKDTANRITGIKRSKPAHEAEIEKVTKGQQDMNAILLQALNSLTWIELEPQQLRVLQALFINRHGAFTLQEIGQKTMMDRKRTMLNKAISELIKAKLVISDKDHGPKIQIQKGKKQNKRVYYMLSQEGIKEVMKYNEGVYKLSFG